MRSVGKVCTAKFLLDCANIFASFANLAAVVKRWWQSGKWTTPGLQIFILGFVADKHVFYALPSYTFDLHKSAVYENVDALLKFIARKQCTEKKSWISRQARWTEGYRIWVILYVHLPN